MLFQCLYDRKSKDVFAAGGRYDSLIKAHRPKIGEGPHAVGFSLAWEKLARLPKAGGKSFLKKAEEDTLGIFNTKRVSQTPYSSYPVFATKSNDSKCDVLVASFDAHTLRTAGIEVVSMLWAHDVSAELARDSRSPEELSSRNRDETYSWIVVVKQENVLKVKTMDRKDVPDVEMSTSQLLPWLRIAQRERSSAKQSEAASNATPVAHNNGGLPANPDQAVRVLVAGTRSKKFNRLDVIEQAQANAAALLQTFQDGPIAAVETSDAVLDLIQATALSEPESWRRIEQSVDKNERRYLREIHDMLLAWRNDWETKDASRHAFVYNFRTTKCIYYDLGA